MFGILIYDLIFFLCPVVFLALFILCLVNYLSLVKKSKKEPESVSQKMLKRYLIYLIISAVPLAALVLFVVSVILLMAGAVAFM